MVVVATTTEETEAAIMEKATIIEVPTSKSTTSTERLLTLSTSLETHQQTTFQLTRMLKSKHNDNQLFNKPVNSNKY